MHERYHLLCRRVVLLRGHLTLQLLLLLLGLLITPPRHPVCC